MAMSMSEKYLGGQPRTTTTTKVAHERLFVTPETAEEWLATNQNVRHLQRTLLERYISDMNHGSWHPNFDPIVFNEQGRLINGQHRLTAVVRTGKGQMFSVVRNAPDDTNRGMDQGGSRTMAITHGVGTREAATGAVILHLTTGVRTKSREETLGYIEQYQASIDVVMPHLRKRKLIDNSWTGAAFVIAHAHSGQPGTVLSLLEDIAELRNGHPSSKMITRWLENSATRKGTGYWERADRTCALLRAIEGHLVGDPVGVIRPTTLTLRAWVPGSRYRDAGDR